MYWLNAQSPIFGSLGCLNGLPPWHKAQDQSRNSPLDIAKIDKALLVNCSAAKSCLQIQEPKYQSLLRLNVCFLLPRLRKYLAPDCDKPSESQCLQAKSLGVLTRYKVVTLAQHSPKDIQAATETAHSRTYPNFLPWSKADSSAEHYKPLIVGLNSADSWQPLERGSDREQASC